MNYYRYWNARKLASTTSRRSDLIQGEVIAKEIRPALEKDGGSIELIDLEGDVVIVALKGRCASCPNAKLTLKKLVQSKLNEFVSDSLVVREA